ncbi:MAG: CDP-alcohol phosphatidyltransferase family protein [Candidatus Kapabacteria bacterium]|nr:CDP-alcohol phosphatidyltransferase family protein [Candidatus Kapabacteria bacterium]
MHTNRWTASNLLSALRLIMAFPIGYLVYLKTFPVTVSVLVIIACFTDYLDGYIARRFNQVSEFGKVIDPIADKVCISVSTIALFANGTMPLWLIAMILGRDAVILVCGIFVQRRYGITMMSNMAGKITVTVLALVMLLMTVGFDSYRDIQLGVAASALILSFVLYAIAFARTITKSSSNLPPSSV